MKIVSLLGSPRTKSSSSTLASIVAENIDQDGKEYISHNLNKLNYRGCQGCMKCKGKNETCILKDDLTSVLQDVTEADVVIMATPVYWGDVSAQMKGFIDRTYSFLTPGFMTDEVKHRLPSGKKLVFIQTQGAPEPMYGEIFERYNSFFTMLNYFTETHLIRGYELSTETDVREMDTLVGQAEEVGRKL
ncbi:MAG: flavodoxin family protein [Desulfotalea sp.]